VSAYASLLSPLTLRGKTFRNRVVSSGHAPGYSENGLPGPRYQAYHVEKAKGGLGLTIVGGSANIARDSGSIYGQIFLGSDRVIPVFQDFADRIHRAGALLFCKMTHMGRRTSWDSGDWLATKAPSALRDPAHRAVPYEMDQAEIAAVIGDFADAAARCKAGGLDGCEILATTHLLGQFLSPLSNRRDDAYGGSLENRARFLMQVLEAVRERVGADFLISLRYAADEGNEDGLTADEGIDLAARLGAQGAADILNVNGVYGANDIGLAENFPGMAFKSAPYVALAKRVREASGLAVLQAARLSDPATADWAIREGYLDLAGMTRPQMADPHLVAKLMSGQETRIRPCVGAGYCIDRIYGGREAFCTHNASTGRELSLPHAIAKAAAEKAVAVVGGGPAGLEAARVAALRGHAVTLYEASGGLGGQLRLAAKAGWRKDMIGIADWLAREIEHLGVAVHVNRYIEGPELLDAGYDCIVVASGGYPDLRLPEGGEDLVRSTWSLLSGEAQPADDILLYDEGGSHAALATADWLAQLGKRIEFVTPDRQIGRAVGGQNLPVYLRNLYRAGAILTPDHSLLSVRREGNGLVATLRNAFSRSRHEIRASQVVVETQTRPADDVFRSLRESAANRGTLDLEALLAGVPQPAPSEPGFMLYRIGDALAARDIHAAILDANRLCRTI